MAPPPNGLLLPPPPNAGMSGTSVVTISDGTNTHTTASWTGKTFTLSAAAGHIIADDAVIRLTW